jgi:hypothetical protein
VPALVTQRVGNFGGPQQYYKALVEHISSA